MAINATFQADFTSFFNAVQQAEVSLKSFDSGAAKVETSLTRMANSLNGTKMIQDATLMVEAVERVGGVSKLTERQLAGVAAQAREAAEKLTKMGQDVPPGLQKIADATKTIDSAQSTLVGSLQSVAAAFGIAFSLNALVGAVGKVIAFGGSMTDLAARTGISTTGLQQFKYAGEQVGVSLDTIVGVVGQLQNRIAGGDKSALAALDALGINFDKLRAMSPEEQFRLIADKLGDVTDQAGFVATGMDLMGRGFLEVAPLIKADLDALIQKAGDLGVVLNDQTIANLDEMGDSLTSLKAVGTAVLADLLKPMLPLLTELAKGFLGVGDWIRKAQIAFEQFLSMSASGLATLTEWQIRLLKLTNTFGMNSEKIATLTASVAELRSISTELSTTQNTVAASVERTTAAFVPFVVHADAAATAAKKGADALNDKAKALDLVEPKVGSLTTWMRTATKATDDWNTKLRFTSEVIGDLVPEVEQLASATEGVSKKSAAAPARAQGGNATSYANETDWTKIPLGVRNAMAAQRLGMPSDWSNYFLGGVRAEGGPVSAGSTYLVGEKGPELFTPSRSGSILANGSGGATLNLTLNITHPLGTPTQIADVVGDVLMQRLRSTGMRFPTGA